MRREAAASLVGALLTAGCATGAPSTPAGPPAGVRWDYQLGGASEPGEGVGIVVRDRTAAPAADVYSVCYVNAFQTQPGGDGVPPDLLLRTPGGAPVEDPDWPGEFLLDVSADGARDRVVELVGGWVAVCAADGFDAVELDNLDSWTRSAGLLARSDSEAVARALTARAHEAGLAAAQKNAAELAGTDLGFDFAVAEECAAYGECGSFASAYDVVLAVEYADGPFAAACAAGLDGVSVVRRDRDVRPPGEPGAVTRWCP
ncbi:endo alpha-1,4 polygalactosaminidase [Geodermatophilus sp. FMUSA9-8]|uniref:endo alpha-1,4 polygalactosaminidase n=1 Tax=Geodermatophilus sp. FMUSA9-8 TaxID=3120155 RepID=UPI003009FC3E